MRQCIPAGNPIGRVAHLRGVSSLQHRPVNRRWDPPQRVVRALLVVLQHPLRGPVSHPCWHRGHTAEPDRIFRDVQTNISGILEGFINDG